MASNFPTAYVRVASQTYVLQHILLWSLLSGLLNTDYPIYRLYCEYCQLMSLSPNPTNDDYVTISLHITGAWSQQPPIITTQFHTGVMMLSCKPEPNIRLPFLCLDRLFGWRYNFPASNLYPHCHRYFVIMSPRPQSTHIVQCTYITWHCLLWSRINDRSMSRGTDNNCYSIFGNGVQRFYAGQQSGVWVAGIFQR